MKKKRAKWAFYDEFLFVIIILDFIINIINYEWNVTPSFIDLLVNEKSHDNAYSKLRSSPYQKEWTLIHGQGQN